MKADVVVVLRFVYAEQWIEEFFRALQMPVDGIPEFALYPCSVRDGTHIVYTH